MRAVIIYESTYGNTRAIAESEKDSAQEWGGQLAARIIATAEVRP